MRLNKSGLRILAIGIFLLFGSLNIFAQTATLKGFVYLKKTGEPMLYTYVYLQGTTFGTTTDVNGFFSLTKIPEGTYEVIVASLGYDTIRENITLKKDEIINKKFYVGQTGVNLNGISISAAQQRRVRETDVSTYIITPKDMKQIPTIGGQPDIAQYLQVLPGVVFTGDQGGQLYIEGGQPIQNKVLLDGMTVFEPFHSIGLFSVFDGDIISDATVYAGGFNAEYGDRISSIMDIRTRDGNKKNITGKIDASPFGAHALVEGPLIKNKNDDPDKAALSFILSAKNSYLGQTSKTIYPWVDSGRGIPFDFADYYSKLSLTTANGSKINVFGFDYTDKVTYPGIDSLKWSEIGVGLNFILVPGSSTSLLEGNVDFSNYSVNDKELYSQPAASSINTFSMGLKNTQFLGNLNVIYGFDISGTRTHYDITNIVNREVTIDLTSNEIKGFLKFKWLLFNKKLVFEPGFRLQSYSSADFSKLSPEPRIDAKYNISKKFRVKIAAGIYSQNLISAINEEQVVDLFYAILTSPPTADIPGTFTTQGGNTYNVTNPLQRAYHVTAGVEFDPTEYIHINVEAYEKNFLQTSTLNYNQIYDNSVYNNAPDTLKKPFLIQSGQAYGADISVRYDHKRLTLYGVYSLGYVNYWTGTYAFPPPFDRRHNVNLIASYTFGKDLSWMVDVRYNYGSGFPFTPTQGFYPNVPFSQLNTNYTTTNGNMGILYGVFDSQRLPDYSRLDVSIDKTFQLSQAIGLHINASVINVLNRDNIFYYNRNTDQRVNQLPILPTLSVAMTF